VDCLLLELEIYLQKVIRFRNVNENKQIPEFDSKEGKRFQHINVHYQTFTMNERNDRQYRKYFFLVYIQKEFQPFEKEAVLFGWL
jgi:hypothetical protein